MTDQQRKDLIMGQTRRILSNLRYKPAKSEVIGCLVDVKWAMFPETDIEFTLKDAEWLIDHPT